MIIFFCHAVPSVIIILFILFTVSFCRVYIDTAVCEVKMCSTRKLPASGAELSNSYFITKLKGSLKQNLSVYLRNSRADMFFITK